MTGHPLDGGSGPLPAPASAPLSPRISPEVVLEVRDLHKAFGTLTVLDGISFEVRPGDVLSMIGASGSGKSTLLRCINLLEQPTSGEIRLAGTPMGFRTDEHGRRRPDSLRNINRMRMDVGMVFQQFNLWPHMTVLGNVVEHRGACASFPRTGRTRSRWTTSPGWGSWTRRTSIPRG